jgi:ATP-dependent RNA helicase DHX57
LHSSLSSEEQSMIFVKTKQRKIVISTNLAETSITIDDCVFVVEVGRMKEKRFDPAKNMESLDTIWVSKANALQRKGRAGRVMAGLCFHLYTQFRYDNHFRKDPVPEIHRVPLEQMLLRIKIMPLFHNKLNVKDVLANLIEPPNYENVNSALERLRGVGALDQQEALTPLGYHLASLPVDVRIGKLMILGAMFKCLDSTLTMAACLSYKSPFVAPFSKREEARKRRMTFALWNSDQITDLQAYNAWRTAQKVSYNAGYAFCQV